METTKYKGYTIQINQDADPQSPREWNNASKMVCWHRRYHLGDLKKGKPISENYDEPIDLLYELAGLDRDDCQDEDGNDWSFANLVKSIEERGTIIQPLYLYDHSGITISTSSFSCPWDSGQVGFVYITKETILEEWGGSEDAIEKARKCLENEVEVYDDYLVGNVYGYTVYAPNETEEDDDEQLDSCWGFYGYNHDKSGLLEAAQDFIDWHIQEKEKRDLLLGKQLNLEL